MCDVLVMCKEMCNDVAACLVWCVPRGVGSDAKYDMSIVVSYEDMSNVVTLLSDR